MAKNDLFLLDNLLTKKAADYPDLDSVGAVFEAFAFEQILKDYDLSYDELSSGWVDGPDDGGIDGFFVFLDGLLLMDKPDERQTRRNPDLEVVIITSKHGESFKQVPINNLIASIQELFDLSKDSVGLVSVFDEDLLQLRELFSATCRELSPRQPKLKFSFYYASRGNTASIADNVRARADYAVKSVKELFSDCAVTFRFVGASELLDFSRQQKVTSLRLRFIENYVSRARTNYVVLSRLSDFYQFLADEHGKLRRYLFQSNVRDYLGRVPVNIDIEETLRSGNTPEDFDFWWLNNGVTILASAAHVVGKEISLENVEIVNGLQTSETLYTHFSKHGATDDERAILIKIIVSSDAAVRDRIIKATNYQSPVELSSLRATDKIQRDIEEALEARNWFYDRRRHYFKNLGKPVNRIISPAFLAACVYALILKEPKRAVKLTTKFMRIEAE